MKRIAEIIRVKKDRLSEYVKLHNNIPDEVLVEIKKANISNYSIFLDKETLFAYFEYTGDDFERDMSRMAKSEIIKIWWRKTDLCQEPFLDRDQGDWWKKLEQVFLWSK
ncbi:L-rhamnose mutarotase [Francisella halioticida]|nr:L-rhamnose mutarotase [Francisella halioticida]